MRQRWVSGFTSFPAKSGAVEDVIVQIMSAARTALERSKSSSLVLSVYDATSSLKVTEGKEAARSAIRFVDRGVDLRATIVTVVIEG